MAIKNITKALSVVSSSIILVSLLGTNNAYAAEGCKPPLAFVDGVQEYDGSSTTGILVARGKGRKLRVRFNSFSYEDGRVTCNMGDKPGFKKTEKSALIDKEKHTVLRTPYVEFEGEIDGKIGDTVTIVFTDISGNNYNVVVKIKDGYAEQGAVDGLEARKADKVDVDKKADKVDVDRKADKGDSYTKQESDDRYAPKDALSLLGGEGRLIINAAPAMYYRPKFDVNLGFVANVAYRFGNPGETGFQLALNGGYTQQTLPTRAVFGVPHTETEVPLSRGWIGPVALADITAGKYVDFLLGGGLLFAWDSYPGTSVGQDPATGTVWGVHPSGTMFSMILTGQAGVRFWPGNEVRRGFMIGIDAYPGIELVPTKKVAGDDNKDNKFVFAGTINVGFGL